MAKHYMVKAIRAVHESSYYYITTDTLFNISKLYFLRIADDIRLTMVKKLLHTDLFLYYATTRNFRQLLSM